MFGLFRKKRVGKEDFAEDMRNKFEKIVHSLVKRYGNEDVMLFMAVTMSMNEVEKGILDKKK